MRSHVISVSVSVLGILAVDCLAVFHHCINKDSRKNQSGSKTSAITVNVRLYSVQQKHTHCKRKVCSILSCTSIPCTAKPFSDSEALQAAVCCKAPWLKACLGQVSGSSESLVLQSPGRTSGEAGQIADLANGWPIMITCLLYPCLVMVWFIQVWHLPCRVG